MHHNQGADKRKDSNNWQVCDGLIIIFCLLALVPKAMTFSLHWQVFWLAQLFFSLPISQGNSDNSKKAILELTATGIAPVLHRIPF